MVGEGRSPESCPLRQCSLLGIPLIALLFSCASGPEVAPEVPLSSARTGEELRAILDSICSRTDIEAMIARARIYSRLRDKEPSFSPTLMALGDEADLHVLSHGAPAALKSEAAARLGAHFRERAEKPECSRSSFPGPLGEPLRQVVLLTIATFFGESSSRRELSASLEKLASSNLSFSEREGLSPEGVRIWRKRAAAASARALEVGSGPEPLESSVDARKFSEAEPARHLEDGTRAADLGTREKADRAEPEGILQWYLLALAHYGVVKETVSQLTPAQEHALAAQEIVVRSLCDLVRREP